MRRTPLLLLPALFLGGCNVFEGVGSDLSSDASVLVSDGRAALGSGNTQQAMRIFQRAVATAANGSYEQRVAKLGLASAMIQNAGINVLTLEALASDLEETTHSSVAPYAMPAGAVCSFGAGEAVVGEIDLATIEGYNALRSNVATLRDAHALILEALDLPGAATRAQIETGIQKLRTQGADTSLLAGALADGAVASIGVAYDRIVKAGAGEIDWLVLQSGGDRYVGFCAPSASVKARVGGETACALPTIGSSVSMVEVRATFYPAGSMATEVSTKAREAYTTLGRELSGTCAG